MALSQKKWVTILVVLLAMIILGAGSYLFFVRPVMKAVKVDLNQTLEAHEDKMSHVYTKTLAANTYAEAWVYVQDQGTLEGFEPKAGAPGLTQPCEHTPIINVAGSDVAVFVEYCDREEYHCMGSDGARDVEAAYARGGHAVCGTIATDGDEIDRKTPGVVSVATEQEAGGSASGAVRIDIREGADIDRARMSAESDEPEEEAMMPANISPESIKTWDALSKDDKSIIEGMQVIMSFLTLHAGNHDGSYAGFDFRSLLLQRYKENYGKNPDHDLFPPSACGTKERIDIAPDGSSFVVSQSLCNMPGKSICKEGVMKEKLYDMAHYFMYITDTEFVRKTYHCQ